MTYQRDPVDGLSAGRSEIMALHRRELFLCHHSHKKGGPSNRKTGENSEKDNGSYPSGINDLKIFNF